MKKFLLSLTFLFFVCFSFSQITILDFETPTTSVNFGYFGSSLEPGTSMVVANPTPGGINTSAMVSDFMKPIGAEVWAGGFAVLSEVGALAIDLTTNTEICVKVLSSAVGNLAVKLEDSSTGGANWIKTEDITTPNVWQNLCFDVQVPSAEDPFEPAFSHIYDKLVLFFDFGSSPAADMTYYLDDVVIQGGGGATEGDVTFRVDMNEYTGSFNTVFVSGEFNNWDAAANPLADDDLDGVWEGTIADLPIGNYQYKFQVDGWADSDQFGEFETCTISDGTNVNRRVNVFGDTDIDVVCFGSCYACDEGVKITVEVGTSHIVVDANGIYLAGGGNFGAPGDFPLNDDDGDQIWSISFERTKDFESFYTFTNGLCPDFSCKEDIGGLPCANPDNFNDRKMGPFTDDTVIASCFGECTDNTDDCGANQPDAGDITFRVDMNSYPDPFTTPYVSGGFNGWDGEANPMEDLDADGIWETTILINGGAHQFKFQLDNWAADEQFTEVNACNVEDGQFINRGLDVDGNAEFCFVWNTCDACTVGTNDFEIDNSFFTLAPNVVSNSTTLFFSEAPIQASTISVYDIVGNLKFEMEMDPNSNQLEIPTSGLAAGVHLIKVKIGNKIGTQRFVKQ